MLRRLTALAYLLVYLFSSFNSPLIEFAHGLSHLIEGHGHSHAYNNHHLADKGDHTHHTDTGPGVHSHSHENIPTPDHGVSHSHRLLTFFDLDIDEDLGNSERPIENKKVEQLDKHYSSPTQELDLVQLSIPLQTAVYAFSEPFPLGEYRIVSPPPEARG